MHHLFIDIPPEHLAYSPYLASVTESIHLDTKDLSLLSSRCGKVYLLPNVASFVGGDAVADCLAVGLANFQDTRLLIDIGTNAELVLSHEGRLLCCSAPSGPAFEGMHIKHGMKAVSGAIEKVEVKDFEDVSWKTIEDKKPIGICGSGVLDAVAQLVKVGAISNNGNIVLDKGKRIRVDEGIKEFVIAWANESATTYDIVITQRDVREIQLAKGAIRSAWAILLKKAGIEIDDLDKVYVAGSFGRHIDPSNAKVLGLLPALPNEKIEFVGNTAVTGAKMCLLSVKARKEAEKMAKAMKYVELAVDQEFRTVYAESLPFSCE